MYCLKCKKHTNTKNESKIKTKNNKLMLKGQCMVCGKGKAQFIKIGKGIVNSIINKLPMEMHLPGHNFTGPGTQLKKRLNPDDTPKSWSKPINRIDKAALKHDLCYRDNPDRKIRNKICDKNMLDELDNIENPTFREKTERLVVKSIIGTKKRFGLGINQNK